jgi:hypothetical protein
MKSIGFVLFLFVSACAHLPTEPVDYDTREGWEAIQKVVEYHEGEIRKCYSTELFTRPNLEVKIWLSFYIDSNGVPHEVWVKEATGCSVDDPLALCLRNAFASWKFPSGKTGGIRGVFPIDLTRRGGGGSLL